MRHLHLHSYPKVFNSEGFLKALPLRHPLRANFFNAFWVGTAIIFLLDAYREWTFTQYCPNDFFKRDVPPSLSRGLSFCFENGPSTR